VRGLLLIDLDNVLHDLGAGALETFTQRACRQMTRIGATWSVAFVLNTETACRYELTYEGLREAGRQLGGAAGDPNARVEIGIALTMPQAADVLLARLAREAPSETSSGPYQRAIVFTGDHGLAAALGRELYGRNGCRWIQTRDHRWLGTEWHMPDGGKPVVRKAPPTQRSRQLRAPSSENSYTICVAPGLEKWAAGKGMDADSRQAFLALAADLEESPWLLSQVGATRSTLRGIGRLCGLPSAARPVLGPVEPRDGLEVRGNAAMPAQGRRPVNASVGIGAVRFEVSHTTVASRLSASVLESASAAFSLDRRGVMVGAALQQLALGCRLGTKTVKVRFSRKGDWLVAKVEHGSTSQPQAWWLTGETKVSSELRMPHPALLPTTIVVAATPIRPSASFAKRLALTSPVSAGDEVVVQAPIAAGTIGLALTQPTFGKARPVAIYSPARPLQPQDQVHIAPIQLVSRRGRLGAAPQELWSLPITVAQ